MSPTARGMALMIIAIFMFSTMDAIAKSLMPFFEVEQIVWARYTGQMVIVAGFLMPRLTTLVRTSHLGLQLLRSALLFAATFLFFTSISRMEIASATAVMNIHPMILTIGAALFLGEALGPRRIFAIAMAFVGALIIIRPGSDIFSTAALLPLGAGFCYGTYSLATRLLGRDEHIMTSYLYTALIGTICATALTWPVWQAPELWQWGAFLGLGCVAALGQYSLIRSLTIAEAGAVAPFGYAGVLFSTLYGLFFFSEVPDALTILGAVIIVASGLFVWYRETRATQAQG